ncbi:DNA-directed RNA polymerases I and III subunit RPAC2 isoform X2 [Misgurnus anguillicaudatus]|uniref:DNA-directed RNA polymerases I and III subunit RPAC2 isoform X2 n=1 Tax=Misgurnus anguillicaudatus TaxID=75329 RepID=UPI0024357520|nr:DNA-directed RNA polymerases I and III subunit RPAC2 [Misgurnus anguillicaudatus]
MTDSGVKHALELVQAEGADEGCVTFVLHEEDHTLGNSLRYMIMKSQDVEFCGYSITHPSESKINFRVQTRGGLPASEPLRCGLNNLTEVCKHVLYTFEAQMNAFKNGEASME